MTDLDDIAATLAGRMPTHRADLEALVAIPSVSAEGFDPTQVRRSAEQVRDLLAARGWDNARLLELDGAHPAVYADWLGAGPDAPTVLLYAHHDVQPPGSALLWTSPPFEPTQRDGRLYGRGAADDKAGVMVHVAAADAWLQARGSLPVNVKVFVEGEEEIGSEHLGELLATYLDVLRADVIVVTDTDNWRVGVPGITYLLRGLVDCEVQLRSLDHAVHSGMYGGPVPDPVLGLIRLLAGLTDERGVVAIPGFADDARQPTDDERRRLAALDFTEERFRTEAGLLAGVDLIGDTGVHVLERLWLQPAVSVIGFDAPAVATASNTIHPSARAVVSVRLAPGQDPQRAMTLLTGWLAEHVPWGLEATITPGAAGAPFLADPQAPRNRPVFDAAARALSAAYGCEPVLQGLGGSIPFLAAITGALGGQDGPAPALLLGVEDPDTRAHGIDESLHLADWERACLGEAYLFAELAAALRR